MSLKQLRKKIDVIDKKITELLNARAGLSLDIAGLKKKVGGAIYVPEREREVLNRVTRMSKGPVKPKAMEAIYREIMSASLSLEKPLKIAYLGPEATFTQLAAIKRFGSQVQYVSCDSIAGVFSAVSKDNADYGVVPIENSVEGMVTHTLDMLIDSDLKICAQIVLDITQNLLANCPLSRVKKVYSKMEVFGQARMWLRENLPNAELIEVSSTSRAAQIAAKGRFSACIASSLAAKIYGLKIVASAIEDSPHNITRFMVVGSTDAGPTGQDKTSILFSVKDRVGALHDMLVPFRKNGINLTKIESRPSKKKAWDYYFFVDLMGHKDSPRVLKALKELERKCTFLKILGSYPIGE